VGGRTSLAALHGEIGIFNTPILNMDTLVRSLAAFVKGQTTITKIDTQN
jgi:hypothetical protein